MFKTSLKVALLILPFLAVFVQAQTTLNVTGIPGSFDKYSIGCEAEDGATVYSECLGAPEVGLAAQLTIRNDEKITYGVPALSVIEYNGQEVSARVIGVTSVGSETPVNYTAIQLAIAFVEYSSANTTACINIPGSPAAIYAVQLAVATEYLSDTVWPSIPTGRFPGGTTNAAEVLIACAGRDLTRTLPLEI